MVYDVAVDYVFQYFTCNWSWADRSIVFCFWSVFILPPLYTGVISAFFQSLGILSCFKDALNNSTKTSAMSFEHIFRILAETSSGPPAVFVFSWFRSLITPFLVTVNLLMMVFAGWPRLVGIEPSSSEKTLVNCSFRILAISASLMYVVPLLSVMLPQWFQPSLL